MDDYTAKRLVKERRSYAEVQRRCDEQNLPYPPELCKFLMKVQRIRDGNRSNSSST